ARIRCTHMMKCSGVFPVGREMSPPGFLMAHSMKRSAVRRPRRGKLSDSITRIFSVGEYMNLRPDRFSATGSTDDVASYVLIQSAAMEVCTLIPVSIDTIEAFPPARRTASATDSAFFIV